MTTWTIKLESVAVTRAEALAKALQCLAALVSKEKLQENHVGTVTGNASALIEVRD